MACPFLDSEGVMWSKARYQNGVVGRAGERSKKQTKPFNLFCFPLERTEMGARQHRAHRTLPFFVCRDAEAKDAD